MALPDKVEQLSVVRRKSAMSVTSLRSRTSYIYQLLEDESKGKEDSC